MIERGRYQIDRKNREVMLVEDKKGDDRERQILDRQKKQRSKVGRR